MYSIALTVGDLDHMTAHPAIQLVYSTLHTYAVYYTETGGEISQGRYWGVPTLYKP